MNKLPQDVSMIIYRYVHEMCMDEICFDLKKSFIFLNNIIDYLRKRVFYPYLIIDRIYDDERDKCFKNNFFFRQKIDKYIHYKKMKRCLEDIIKPDHLFF
jgi:hypothetical protein